MYSKKMWGLTCKEILDFNMDFFFRPSPSKPGAKKGEKR